MIDTSQVGPEPLRPNLCMACSKAPAALEKNGVRLCFKCAGIGPDGNPLPGGVVDQDIQAQKAAKASGEGENILNPDFLKGGKLKRPQVVGCDVVFCYDDGVKRLVRTTDAEQMDITGRIVSNRRHGKKEFQHFPVLIIPMALMLEINDVIERCAAADPVAQAAAQELLRGLRGQAKDAEKKEGNADAKP